MAGLRELDLGQDAVLYAITPDPPERTRELAAKIAAEGDGELGFPLLSDPGSETIDRYAIRDPAYAGTENDGLPHPAVFIVDREGRVRWSRIESDYRQRPSLDEIQAALDSIE